MDVDLVRVWWEGQGWRVECTSGEVLVTDSHQEGFPVDLRRFTEQDLRPLASELRRAFPKARVTSE